MRLLEQGQCARRLTACEVGPAEALQRGGPQPRSARRMALELSRSTPGPAEWPAQLVAAPLISVSTLAPAAVIRWTRFCGPAAASWSATWRAETGGMSDELRTTAEVSSNCRFKSLKTTTREEIDAEGAGEAEDRVVDGSAREGGGRRGRTSRTGERVGGRPVGPSRACCDPARLRRMRGRVDPTKRYERGVYRPRGCEEPGSWDRAEAWRRVNKEWPAPGEKR